MKELLNVANKVLSHIDIYLSKLDNEAYKKPLPLLSNASIGGHTRHILDGFLCLMKQQNCDFISYDLRERDQQIECKVDYATSIIEDIKCFIKTLDQNESYDFEVNYSDHKFRTKSSLQREVIHNIEHVIHHLAIIKIALLYYHPKIQIPMAFGVAPSTLRYWEKEGITLES